MGRAGARSVTDGVLSERADGQTGNVSLLHNWARMSHPKRVAFLRDKAEEYGRDPRMAQLAVQILRVNGIDQREYPKMAAALLAYVQDKVFYVNEPGERIASPWRTLEWGLGDCDDMALLLNALACSIGLPNKYMLIGRVRKTGQVVRWVEGTRIPRGWATGKAVDWFHITSAIGWPFGAPAKDQHWAETEPTLKGSPLGYSIVRHGVKMGTHGDLSLPKSATQKGALSWYKGLPPNGGDTGKTAAPAAANYYGGLASAGLGSFGMRRPGKVSLARMAPTVGSPTALAGIPVPGFRGSGWGADADDDAPRKAPKPYWRQLSIIAVEAAVGGIATFIAISAAESWLERRSKRRKK
jgi:hypothetical protein